MCEFKTDGELYDASLTCDTKEDAFQLYKDILDWLDRYGFVNLIDIVIIRFHQGPFYRLISHFPAPRNWVYAKSHGYDRFDVANFTVRPTDDGEKWCLYLGSPRKLR